MQLFNVSQPRSLAKPPVAMTVPSCVAAPEADPETKPEACGWYDSSFDLASGMEITEQADDMLYQLCKYFLN